MARTRGLNALVTIPLAMLLAGWAAAAGKGPGEAQGDKPPQPAADAELHRLLKTRYESAAKMLQIEEERLRFGQSTMALICEAWRLVADSFIELPVSPEERVAMLAKYVSVMQALETDTVARVRFGKALERDIAYAQYLRADAEIKLLRAKRQASAAP